MRLLPALSAWLFLACTAEAQPLPDRTWASRLFTTADGLVDRLVTDVHRDGNGYLWILGQHGLQRFDGHRFEVFNHLIPDSLQRSLIGVTNFHVDPDGWIWMVDPSGVHALRFDPLTGQHEVLPAPVVLPTGPGMVRLCTVLFPYYDILRPLGDPSAVRKRFTEHMGEDRIRAIQRTADGRIWVHGDHSRLVAVDPRTGSVSEPVRKIMPGRIHWPMLDAEAGLWLPDINGGLTRLQLPASVLDRTELTPHLDQRGGLWLQAEGNRLYEVDPHTGQYTDHGMLAAGIVRVYRDDEGLVWLCTDVGLMRLREQPTLFRSIGAKPVKEDEAIVGNSMRGIVEVPEGGWIAFNDMEQLLRIDPDGAIRQLTPPTGVDAPPVVRGLLRASNGGIWSFSASGLHRWQAKEEAFDAGRAPARSEVASVYADATGGRFLAFLHDGHACFFDPLTERYGPVFHLPKAPRTAVLFSGHQVLLPDDKGLRQLDTRTLAVRTIDLQLDEPLVENGVRGLAHLAGLLHLATSNGILSVDTSTWTVVRRVSEAQGLADPVVYSLLSDGHRLWAGTRNGLSMVDPVTGACVNFRMAEGLPSNEFNTGAVLLDRSGHCWMGGVNGFVRFDPMAIASIPVNPAQLRTVHLRSSDERATSWTDHPTGGSAPTQGITLRPTERSLAIGFALSSLAKPEAHRYSFYLEGLEPAWYHTRTQAEATYHGLPPGQYSFRVRAFDHRGVAAANELVIPITVLQVWYKRPWALALWAALFVVAVVLLARLVLQRRLVQAEARRIRELDAFKDRFFTNVTHEFRTPLTVIMGVAAQLEQRSESDDTAATVQRAGLIQRNSKRLLDLVDQVLDLTRLRHGHLVLDPRPADLQAFLQRTIAMHRSYAEVRGVDLRTEFQCGPCSALFDAERLRQVIDNLIGNALKFTPAGGHVQVLADVVQEASCTLTLIVRDTGPGITPEDLPRIFDRFHQGREGAATGGTGIGLALVKELVEAMGGSITAESTAGKGSTFTLRLDLQAAEADVVVEDADRAVEPIIPPSDVPAEGNGQVPAQGGVEDDKPLLLVVEDDPDVREYISSCLGPAYRLLLAVDGNQGLAMAREHVPDLVLSDVMMPGMDGFALCHALKSDLATSHIPVALLTARSDRPSRLEGITRGADAFLVKPFDEPELLGVLRNLHRLQRSVQDRTKRQWEAAPSPIAVDPPATPAPEVELEHHFLAQVRTLLEAHYADPAFGVEELAGKLGLSRSQVFRKVKALTGETPVALLRNCRLAHARTLLAQGGYTVSEVAFACGFSSASYFSDVYLAVHGHRPSEHANA